MPGSDPPIFADSDFELHPREREIDTILRSAFAAGASQVLLSPASPLIFRVGPELVRATPHVLTPGFVADVAESLLEPAERQMFREAGDFELELGLPPWASCRVNIFLAGGQPHLVIGLPGAPVERAPAPPDADVRRPSLRATEEGAMAEIVDCLNEVTEKRRESEIRIARWARVLQRLRVRLAAAERGVRKETRLESRLHRAAAEIQELVRDLRPSLGLDALKARLKYAVNALERAMEEDRGEDPGPGDGGAGVPALLPKDPPGRPRPALRAPRPDSPERDPPSGP